MLEGIRVVELASGVAGPMAALRLGDLGAEVVKVEEEGGDWMRGAAPAMEDGASAAFFALNRGKRALALGPNPRLAAPLLLRLLAQADVFITDRSEAALGALGIGDALAESWSENGRLIVADVSVWGRHGPMAGMPGSELAAQAMAGYTRYLGTPQDPPRRLGADVGGAGAAVFTVQGILAALLARRRGGGGQRVSTSLLNALMSMKSIQLAAQSDPDQYEGPRVGGPHDPPERGWRTADRPIFFSFGGSVGAEGRPGWSSFVEEIGMGELLADSRLDRNGRNSTGHGSRVHEMRETYEKGFASYTADDLVERIRARGANAAVYMHADETLAHPQTAALHIVHEVPAGGASARVRAFPARFSGGAPPLRGNAPALGQHGSAIAREAGLSRDEMLALRDAGGLILPEADAPDGVP
jgi:crotonobetainyl-CoA:carnitine CoA-transferase CaiB-like acyl-CoA transferase